MEKSPVITLTTDLGDKDPYLPAAKGKIASDFPSANIIDISHQIAPFDIGEAAYILKNCFRNFPSGTIHIISLSSGEAGKRPPFIITYLREQYFIGADNGVIALLDEEPPESVYEIKDQNKAGVFPLKDLLVPAGCMLLKGYSPDQIGKKQESIRVRRPVKPLIHDKTIRGTVIYIDRFGNAITNITRQDLLRFSNFNECKIHFSRKEYFEEIHSAYHEVPEGEKICIIGTNDHLEVAINRGNASQLLGIEKDHLILIEFS